MQQAQAPPSRPIPRLPCLPLPMLPTCRHLACPTVPSSSPWVPFLALLASQSCSGAPSLRGSSTVPSRRLPWHNIWPTTRRPFQLPPSTSTATTTRRQTWVLEEVFAEAQEVRSHLAPHLRRISSFPRLLPLAPTRATLSIAIARTGTRRTGTRASFPPDFMPLVKRPRKMWTAPTVPPLASTICGRNRVAMHADYPATPILTRLALALNDRLWAVTLAPAVSTSTQYLMGERLAPT